MVAQSLKFKRVVFQSEILFWVVSQSFAVKLFEYVLEEMRFPALLAVILLASTTLAGPHFIHNSSDDDDDAIRIFKHASDRW